MAADFGVINHDVVGDITTNRHDIFIQIIRLVRLRSSADDQPKAVAALLHKAILLCGAWCPLDERIKISSDEFVNALKYSTEMIQHQREILTQDQRLLYDILSLLMEEFFKAAAYIVRVRAIFFQQFATLGRKRNCEKDMFCACIVTAKTFRRFERH